MDNPRKKSKAKFVIGIPVRIAFTMTHRRAVGPVILAFASTLGYFLRDSLI